MSLGILYHKLVGKIFWIASIAPIEGEGRMFSEFNFVVIYANDLSIASRVQ